MTDQTAQRPNADDQALQQGVPPVTQAPDDSPQATAVSIPAAPASKEQQPLPTRSVTEYATEQEPIIAQEVAQAGVEGRNEKPRIPDIAAQAGLEPAKESVPVPANPAQISWPITGDKAQAILKAPHIAIMQSVAWLATLVAKMVKKQQIQSKEAVQYDD